MSSPDPIYTAAQATAKKEEWYRSMSNQCEQSATSPAAPPIRFGTIDDLHTRRRELERQVERLQQKLQLIRELISLWGND